MQPTSDATGKTRKGKAMSESEGTGTSTNQPATPPPVTTPEPKESDVENKSWFTARLERERRVTLERAGFKSEDDAKAAAELAKKYADEQKTLSQKHAEAEARATEAASKHAAAQAVIKEHAERQLVGLTEEQRAAVKAIAGDDAALTLRTISSMLPTWAKIEADKAAADAAAKAAEAAKAKPTGDTVPAPGAPPGVTPQSPPNHRAIYADLKNKNPFAAARYAEEHPEVYSAQPK